MIYEVRKTNTEERVRGESCRWQPGKTSLLYWYHATAEPEVDKEANIWEVRKLPSWTGCYIFLWSHLRSNSSLPRSIAMLTLSMIYAGVPFHSYLVTLFKPLGISLWESSSHSPEASGNFWSSYLKRSHVEQFRYIKTACNGRIYISSVSTLLTLKIK